MVGIVVVSHSRRLAEAAVELSLEMVQSNPPPIEIAAGLDDHILGTDAARVREAIDRVASPDGVLVVMDLGSAILSAELAVELREDPNGCPIVLSDAPLVEGLVAAVTLAAAGAPLAEIAAEASQAGQIKTKLLGVDAATPKTGRGSADALDAPDASIELAIHNQHGLHARPAARLVETVRRFDAEVTVRNLTQPGPAVSGRSLSALSTLGALAGHHVQVSASGRQAREALAAIAALVHRSFDEAVAAGEAFPAPNGGSRQSKDRGSRPAASHSTIPLTNGGAPVVSNARGGLTAASPGVAIGPKASLVTVDLEAVDSPARSPESERYDLLAALEAARAEIASTRDHVAGTAGESEAAIFDAHLLLLDDEELSGKALEAIAQQSISAAIAWRQAVTTLTDRFRKLSNPYLQARAGDVRAVGDQVATHLMRAPTTSVGSLAGIVVAADLTPTQVARLDPQHVKGIVTALGTPVSHCAILARSLGIPAVVGAGEDVLAVPDGTTLLIDGSDGVLLVDPDPAVCAHYRLRAARQRHRAEALLTRASQPAITTDGTPIEVLANIASLDDAVQAVRHGADGVGLLRTEFLFLGRSEPPTEDDQLAIYLSIGETLEGRRLTVRTLDGGADKPLPYLPVPSEANPFLGLRGLRLSLHHTEFFKQQLRALLRTATRYPVTVLFPMVTTIDELIAARSLLGEAAVEIGCQPGALPLGLQVGAMAEVPAFALLARAAVPLVDVISIGSNDLTQYTLAAERGNAQVAALADPLDPAVLKLIAEITRAATTETLVAVCGEIAADPSAAAVLIGLGVKELSMNPRAIPEVKDVIRSLSTIDARRLADRALECDSAASVRALLDHVTA